MVSGQHMKLSLSMPPLLRLARKLAGALIVVLGASYGLQQLLLLLQQQSHVQQAFYAGLMAAAATARKAATES